MVPVDDVGRRLIDMIWSVCVWARTYDSIEAPFLKRTNKTRKKNRGFGQKYTTRADPRSMEFNPETLVNIFTEFAASPIKGTEPSSPFLLMIHLLMFTIVHLSRGFETILPMSTKSLYHLTALVFGVGGKTANV